MKNTFTLKDLQSSKCWNLNSHIEEVLSEKPVKKDKYNTTRVEVITHEGRTRKMSKKQATRYYVLKMLLEIGDITDLELEVDYELMSNDKVKGKQGKFIYRCDARYKRKGVLIVEDTKGFRTEVYKRKKRLMKEIYGIDILET